MKVPKAKTSQAGNPPQVTRERLMKLMWGYAPMLLVEVALTEGVIDSLDKSPLSVSRLAKETGASERGLRMLLNALVGLGFLAKRRERYRLTLESAEYLVSGKPMYYGGLFHHHANQVLPRWLQLRRAVRTGRGVQVRGRKETQKHFAEFVESLSRPPVSAFVADGSRVVVRKGVCIC